MRYIDRYFKHNSSIQYSAYLDNCSLPKSGVFHKDKKTDKNKKGDFENKLQTIKTQKVERSSSQKNFTKTL